MSTKENDELTEALEVWLEEHNVFFHELGFENGEVFIPERQRLVLPDNLQELCLTLKK